MPPHFAINGQIILKFMYIIKPLRNNKGTKLLTE